ncbi:hypothetical protein YC2023_039596 [Brassica napus]
MHCESGEGQIASCRWNSASSEYGDREEVIKKKLYEAKVCVKPWMNFKWLHEFIPASDDAPTILPQILVAKKDVRTTSISQLLPAIPENKAYIQQMTKNAHGKSTRRRWTPAMTTRGCIESDFETVADFLMSSQSLKPSLEAFAFQYEMHASSYQINIATAQQVAKENSPPEDCTRDWCLTVLSATITTRPMVCTVTQILDSNTVTQ